MEENPPRMFSAGKAVTATIAQQELPNSGFGIGTLPFIDCTAADDETRGNPDPAKYKEVALKFLHNAVMGCPTTANNFSASLGRLADGVEPIMKKAPEVYPDFNVMGNRTG